MYNIDAVRLVDVDGNQLGTLSNLLKVGMRLILTNSSGLMELTLEDGRLQKIYRMVGLP